MTNKSESQSVNVKVQIILSDNITQKKIGPKIMPFGTPHAMICTRKQVPLTVILSDGDVR